MSRVFSYPMTVNADGAMATVEDLSEAHIAQEIALMILTEPGERPLVPEYGMDSIDEQDGLDALELSSKLDLFNVPASVNDVRKSIRDDTMYVSVDFDVVAVDIAVDPVTMEYPNDVLQPYETPEF